MSSPKTEKNAFIRSFAVYLNIGAAYAEKEIYLQQENTNPAVKEIPKKTNNGSEITSKNLNKPSLQATKNSNPTSMADAADTTSTITNLLSQSIFKTKLNHVSPTEENKAEDEISQQNNKI